jgi:hypothetical protein
MENENPASTTTIEGRIALTRSEAAQITSLSARQFDSVLRPRLHAQGAGKNLRYDAAEVVAALVAYRLEQLRQELGPRKRGEGGGEEDAPPPALERLRAANADMAEDLRAEKRGQLVNRAELIAAMHRGIAAMRGAGNILAREFGSRAAEIFNVAVGDFELSAITALHRPEPDASREIPPQQPGGADAHGKRAHDLPVCRGGDPPA